MALKSSEGSLQVVPVLAIFTPPLLEDGGLESGQDLAGLLVGRRDPKFQPLLEFRARKPVVLGFRVVVLEGAEVSLDARDVIGEFLGEGGAQLLFLLALQAELL